jgi:hypothetical protein
MVSAMMKITSKDAILMVETAAKIMLTHIIVTSVFVWMTPLFSQHHIMVNRAGVIHGHRYPTGGQGAKIGQNRPKLTNNLFTLLWAIFQKIRLIILRMHMMTENGTF